ncbi:secondary carrier transporter [Lithospermum erythrorhizon]|uniref:Secondary carrier transporter n=1 Tax=Lithospermum erythrorhizon TaxID=34254 RepID=A0AAV3RUH6_LITER
MVEESGYYTLDEALNSVGFGKFQLLVLSYAGMGQVCEAMEMMLLSFVGPAVQSEWSLSSRQESLISSIVFAGMLVGAYSWGLVSDKYGRRKGFLITAMITSGAGFLSAIAPNYTMLIIFRGLVGAGVGGGPVLASWFLEFIPGAYRGTWMVVYSGFWTLGTVLEALLAWIVMPRLGWRWLLTLSALPSTVLLIFYSYTPESPRYLCLNGRTAEALIILEKIAFVNETKLPPGTLVASHEVELIEKDLESEDTKLLSPRKENETASVDSNKGSISLVLMLLSPELIRSTLLLWTVFFGNAFSYYGLVLLTTELNSKHNHCTSTELQSANSQEINYLGVFVTSLAECPGLFIAAAIVDKLGRKMSMSALFFLCSIFLLPLVFHQPESTTTGLLFGARICITGTFTIVYIYAPELYPTSVRSTGVGVASSVGRIGGMLCPLVAVGLIHGCHQTIAVLLFESVVLIAGFAVLSFPFETQGRDLNDTLSSKEETTEILSN